MRYDMRKFKCNLNNFELEADFANKGIRVFQIFPKTLLYESERTYRGMLYMSKELSVLFRNNDYNFSEIINNYELKIYSYSISLHKEVIEYLEGLLIMNTLMGE